MASGAFDFHLVTGQSVLIFIYAVRSFLISVRILMRRTGSDADLRLFVP